MEAVWIRQKGATDFATYYESLCALESICPVSSIRTSARDGQVNCKCDRLRRADWHPLLNALRINKSLRLVCFHTKWQQCYVSGKYSPHDPKRKANTGAIFQKDVVNEFAKAVKSCVSVTTSLKELRIEGIALSHKDTACIAKGLLKNSTIVVLSFKGSPVGDSGAKLVCDAVRASQTLEWLDLTACNLTHEGARAAGALVKHHCLSRHSVAWKDSLRHQRPCFDGMPGLRRVTLNLNPSIGDRGVRELVDSLRDDHWIRAVDLQSCGVTSSGAVCLQEVMLTNRSLVVLDLRANELIDDDILESLYEQLRSNACCGSLLDSRYMWLPVEEEEVRRIYQPPVIAKPQKKKAPSRTGQLKPPLPIHAHSCHARKGKGIPWRTAARTAERLKMYSCKVSSDRVSSQGTSSSICTSTPLGSPVKGVQWQRTTMERGPGEEAPTYDDLLKELELCKMRLHEESRARRQAEERAIELELSNRHLRADLEDLNEKIEALSSSPGLDDDVLEAVETSFQQFSNFLDLLRAKGLGELCELMSVPPVKELGHGHQ